MKQFLRRLYHKLPHPPKTNYSLNKLVVSPYQNLPKNAFILDIGSKNTAGNYSFGSPPADAKLCCVDIQAGEGVDLVADAHNLYMIENDSVDCIIAISTLEHVKRPWDMIKEFQRVLKPGGVMYLNTPFVFPFHADPDDFYRFSNRGIVLLCEGFDILDSGFNRGPASTFVHLLVHFLAIVFSFRSKLIYGILVDLFKWLLFWIKYFDIYLGSHPMAHVIHSGAYVIAQKPQGSGS